MAQRKRRSNLARNEEGEFELVLGNRQLVSVFLIVVVLLGVFFSMGYIVGRNAPTTVTADAQPHSSAPIIVENPSNPSKRTSSNAGDRANSGETQSPEADSSPVVDAKPSPLPALEQAPPARRHRTVELEAKPAEPASKPAIGEPPGGQRFLQVVATSRPDAELIAETLAKKGFHTTIAPGPSAGVFRVLVGPLSGAADKAETRVRLEAAGFKNPYERSY